MSTATTRVSTTLYRTESTGSVAVEDVFATDIEDLWSALTEPDRLARWLVTVTGDLVPGGALTLHFTSGWEGTGEILECDSPTRLKVLTIDLDGDATTLTATLTPRGPGTTRLRIEEDGLQPGRQHVYGAGWAVHLEHLEAYLTGRPRSDWAVRWAELAPALQPAPVLDKP